MKKRLLYFSLLLLFTSGPAFSQVSSCNFKYRRLLTIHHAQVSGGVDLTNFPMLVNIASDATLKSTANGGHVSSASGYDIIFTAVDGVTNLNFQLETYTATTGQYIAWVNIPTLSASVETYIYMYYGNSSVTTNQSSTSAWNTNYAGVWHLQESPTATAPQYADGTTRGENGTTNGMASGDQVAGQIGNAANLSGSSYITFSAASLPVNNAAQTISTWAKYTSTPGGSQNFIALQNPSSGSGQQLGFRSSVPLQWDWGGGTLVAGSTAPSANAWHLYSYTYDGAINTFYIDGVLTATTTTAPQTAAPSVLSFGCYMSSNTSSGGENFTGILDEVHISNTNRTAGWIGTEYNNQFAPNTFYTLAGEPNTWTGGTSTAWSTTTNWSSGVAPAAGVDVIIANGTNQPTLSANTQVNAILLNSGATLSLSTRTFSVSADISNCGTIQGNTGTILMNGATAQAQALSGNGTYAIYNLTINNTSGLASGISSAQTLTVSNLFTLNSGTLNIGTNNIFATGTAAVNAGGISGTGTIVCSGPKVTFGTTSSGPVIVPTVSVTTSSITMQRGTFSNAVNITKISSSSITDSWHGGNTFNGVFTIVNAAVGDTLDPDGDIYLGASNGDPTDVFNANSYFYVTGAARLRCPATGTITFNAPAHFYSQGLSSATKTSYDRIQPARFSPALVTFNDSAIFFCSSKTTDMYIAYEAGTVATFNKPVIATHSGTSQANFYFGGSGTINLNNDVYFNNTGTGTINIVNASDGAATLANGKKLLVGSKGFSSGILTIWNLTQVGTTPQSLTFTGTATLTVGGTGTPCIFNAPVAFSAPNLNLIQSTFNGTTNAFTMSGTANQNCYGANTFASGTNNSFINSSSGYWRLGVSKGDTCKGNAIFQRTSTGALSPAYANTSYFYGDITIASGSDSVDFASGGGGIVNLAGTNAGTFTSSGTKGTSIKRLVLNKTGGAGFTLASPIGIIPNGSLTLTSGLLNTSSSGLLVIQNPNVTVPSLTDASTSYVNGPMVYQLATKTKTALTFPIGTSTDCRPAVLTVQHTTTSLYNYTAQLFNGNSFSAGAGTYTVYPATVDTLSGVHYWSISRTNASAVYQPTLDLGTNTQTVQLFFGPNDGVYTGNLLTVCKTYTNTTGWVDIGKGTSSIGTATNTTAQAGSVTSSTVGPTPFNSFSYFTLGRTLGTGKNPLPIELLSFSAIPDGEKVDIKWETVTETNNAYFTIEKSRDGVNFDKVIDVPGAGNSTKYLDYAETDYQPYAGTSYYRLKQTDENGNFKHFPIVPVNFASQKNIVMYPNPIDNTNNLTIGVNGYKNQEVVVVLRDIQGREFLSKVLLSEENNQLFVVDETRSLPVGTYIVTAASNDKIYNYKLIVR